MLSRGNNKTSSTISDINVTMLKLQQAFGQANN
jgi:hypothetical protein